ncbi:MAG: 30S ribosomal protein S4 [Nitrososphaerales archaeon]
MGDPKKPRKKYSAPKHPWRSDQLSQELFIIGTYGLRNKRELWKARTELSRIRKQARMLLATPHEIREKKEKELLSSLSNLGIVDLKSGLDDVLGLTVENLLERRLQTVVWKKGIALSPYQARQMITHGHVMIGDKIVTRPGYIVKRDEYDKVRLSDSSTLKSQAISAQGE